MKMMAMNNKTKKHQKSVTTILKKSRRQGPKNKCLPKNKYAIAYFAK
jgi:hypothetical protein